MMKKTFCILFLNLSLLLFSQSIKDLKIPDSLKNKDYNYLENSYNNQFNIDNDNAEFFANIILLKGKKEKNEIKILDGYYKLARAINLKGENAHEFADSLIQRTKNINSFDYPSKSHILKGILFNNEGNYKQALNEYVIALKQNNDNNEQQLYYIKNLIAILKTATEEYSEALSLFLEYHKYEKEKLLMEKSNGKSYISSIFSVANIYAKCTEYNKSLKYAQLGLLECKKYNDYSNYDYLQMIVGINKFYLKDYISAYNTLMDVTKGLKKNKDYINLGILYYYLGKIKFETKKIDKSIDYFIKSDSVTIATNIFDPIFRDSYEILIDYYKKKGDIKNQLKYIDKLIRNDSINGLNRKNLSKDIFKKYDTPLLIQEKESLIKKLHNKNILFTSLIIILLPFTLFFIFIIRKNKKIISEYEKRAKLLIEKTTNQNFSEFQKEIVVSEMHTEVSKKSTVTYNQLLNDPKYKMILDKIDSFERNESFLKKNVTLDSLSKELGTNRDYLSKIINESKNNNFSQYINELRINYIIEELKINKKIRKHTIAAIADDIGFNTAESFTNAFKKITGTLPSYYIKLLNEEN